MMAFGRPAVYQIAVSVPLLSRSRRVPSTRSPERSVTFTVAESRSDPCVRLQQSLEQQIAGERRADAGQVRPDIDPSAADGVARGDIRPPDSRRNISAPRRRAAAREQRVAECACKSVRRVVVLVRLEFGCERGRAIRLRGVDEIDAGGRSGSMRNPVNVGGEQSDSRTPALDVADAQRMQPACPRPTRSPGP